MRWVALLAIAGCTQVFGLDSTRDDDRDGDHVPDALDNCPDVANPDQSKSDPSSPLGDACRQCMTTDTRDSDGDGIPDQCDACDNRLPDTNGNGVPDACEHPHDEDGDGHPDLFDNCPAAANQDQRDTTDTSEPDGVGDACDDTQGPDRQLFDGFVQASQLWVLGPGDWTDGNDESHVSCDNSQPATRYAGLGLGSFTLSANVTLVDNGFVGVRAVDSSTPPNTIECGVMRDPGQQAIVVRSISSNITTNAPSMAIASTDHVTVHMTVTDQSAIGFVAVGCSVDDQPAFGGFKLSTTNPIWRTGLATLGYTPPTLPPTMDPITGHASYAWYDLVTTRPQGQ